MVVIECPHCEEHIELDDDASGLFECPFCEGEFEWGMDDVEEKNSSIDLFSSSYSTLIAAHAGLSLTAIIFALISINSLWMGDSATDAGFYLLSFGGEGITISYSQMSESDPSGDFSFLGTIGVLSIILFWIGILLSLVNVVMDGLNLFEVFYFRTTTTLSAISGGIMILTPLLWFALFPFKGVIFEELSLQFGFYGMLIAGIISLISMGISIASKEYLD